MTAAGGGIAEKAGLMRKNGHIQFKKLKFFCLVWGASIFLFAHAGYALTETQTLTTPNTVNPPMDQTLNFTQFDPTLGTLNSIDISVTGYVESNISIQNTSTTNTVATMAAGISGDMYLQLSGTNIADMYNASWVHATATNVAPNTTVNFNNLTGSMSPSPNPTSLTGSSDKSLFTGTGLIALYAYTNFTTFTSTTGSSSQMLVSVQPTYAWEQVTVTYNYDPPAVPEPSTFLLFGTGLFILGLALSRRSNFRHKQV